MFLDKYKVLKVLRSSENISCYLGERNGTGDTGYVLINEISERSLIEAYIKDIAGLTQKESEDFVESFTRESKFYVVFRYVKGDSLKKMLEKEKVSFDFRFSLLEHIIYKMVGVGFLPNVIKANLLQSENIVYENNDLTWNYRFYIEETEIDTTEYMFQQLAKLISELFTAKEIAKKPKLGIIVDKSKKKLYRTFGEVAKDLEDVVEELDDQKTMMAVVEEKKEKAKSTFAQITTVAVICVALFMVFGAIKSREEAASVYSPIENIGAVSLEEESVASGDDIYIGIEEAEDEVEAIEEPMEEPVVEFVEEPVEEVAEEVIEEPMEEAVEEVIEEPMVEAIEEVVEEPIGETVDAEVMYEASIHVVQTGENLWDIVKAYYENSRYVADVAEVNGLESPYILNSGMELILPALTVDGVFLD